MLLCAIVRGSDFKCNLKTLFGELKLLCGEKVTLYKVHGVLCVWFLF